ncbi:hypothetical protein E4T66_18625 [Sinimarinibacterium sp. CAU 1509]|uniref:hypothetical protein n=1 Tax=Sinimarinibacterium sp. CAU 1509 TaxID=2562283 RepID=UPI0010ACBBA2|nr:hypothetical protein [Sinimarinibacterium sp. CAU 1509]TJY57423.1 hypothetical protein E4T66_18625 [Sinimarinibacterium sp. CAU 1509]
MFDDWRGHARPDYRPTARQQTLVDAVAVALAHGHERVADVCAAVAKELAIPEALLRRDDAQGGVYQDVYCAIQYLRHRADHRRHALAHEALAPVAGDILGTLVFNTNYKQTTGCVIESVDGTSITLLGKRGALCVRLQSTALGIRYAMDAAAERGRRRDGWEEFLATRHPVATGPQSQTEAHAGAVDAQLPLFAV